MRRIVSYVLVLLGVFAIALAFLLKLYAYPRLAKVPHEIDSVTVAQGSGITALEIIKKDENDPGEPVINHNLSLTSITHVTPNLREPEVSKDSQVTSWTEASLVTDDNRTTVIDGKAQPLPLDGSVRQLCIDRQTNEAVAPCETQYIQVEKDSVKQVKGERNTVQQPGHSFKLPFNLEKKSYDWYDLGTRKAVQAKFVGEDKVRDLDVYKFVMEIPPTKVETAREVPGKIVGETDATVKVDRYKAGTRTLWVEPTTGAVVAAEDSGRQELVKSGQQFGSGTVVFEGTLRLNDKTVDKLVADAKDNVSKLWPLTDLPIILWIAGGVLVVGGIVLLLTGGGPSTGRRALGNTQREPVGVG